MTSKFITSETKRGEQFKDFVSKNEKWLKEASDKRDNVFTGLRNDMIKVTSEADAKFTTSQASRTKIFEDLKKA